MGKIVFINVDCGTGSTGKISLNQALDYQKQGWDVKFAYGRECVCPEDFLKDTFKITNTLEVLSHVALSRFFDRHGLGSKLATVRLLRWLDDFKPDVLWLHNIHGYFLNYEILFEWIKKQKNLKVNWTLHDCWAFTGHCTNFNAVSCTKWKEECFDCPQLKEYPRSLFLDRSTDNFLKKKNSFLGVLNMELFVPSKWLKEIVRSSFFCNYAIKVLENKVNTEVFKFRQSSFREQYGLENVYIVLGVANAWQKCKGLYDFYTLSTRLPQDCKIVLVGLNHEQMKKAPSNIIGLGKTNSMQELAEIYSAADVFVNPSTEETFGMTVYEASLCGTKVIVYRGTACVEIAEKYDGVIVEPNIDSLYNAIISLKEETK